MQGESLPGLLGVAIARHFAGVAMSDWQSLGNTQFVLTYCVIHIPINFYGHGIINGVIKDNNGYWLSIANSSVFMTASGVIACRSLQGLVLPPLLFL